MSGQERLRQLIEQRHHELRMTVPSDREAAVLSVLRARGRFLAPTGIDRQPDLVSGTRLADLGGNKALRLCLEPSGEPRAETNPEDVGRWAEAFLRGCAAVAEAELVLGLCETGYLTLVEDANGSFDCWATTSLMPATWREREDIEWWATWLARQHAVDVAEPVGDPATSTAALFETMAYQLTLPADASIGGCSMATCREVLRCLIDRALRVHTSGDRVAVVDEVSITEEIARTASLDPTDVRVALAALTVDEERVAWHAAVPAVAAAPLVRLPSGRLALSVYGLTSQPLFFLARELRRRYGDEYHNAAYLREQVFRDDLYTLFQDRRFVTSPGRIKLRRAEGGIRTDIDAAVFDRKTGTLGVFELKSQDPFARSSEELIRQWDNLLAANRQVSGVMTWINRHGGDEILRRFDARTAKTFRVQKVYPFVLGRYLAHFGDGAAPDRRAAWGTWPQMLRLLEEQPARGSSNPIASLHAMLMRDTPLARASVDLDRQVVDIGLARITVFASHATYRNARFGTIDGG